MASELFWTAFAAIGQAVGAIATAAAVIVTLWQVRYSNKKKLKMKFTDKNVVFSERGDSRYFFVNLSVTNIGNRNVKFLRKKRNRRIRYRRSRLVNH